MRLLAIILFIFLSMNVFAQSDYIRWVDGVNYIKKNPNTHDVLGTFDGSGPERSYNELTGEFWVYDPVGDTWKQLPNSSDVVKYVDTASMLSSYSLRTELQDTASDLRTLIGSKLDTSDVRVHVVDSVEEIQTLSANLGDIVFNNDGGGVYDIKADTVVGYSVDGVAVISVGGNYAKLTTGERGLYNIEWFGAVGDGITNNNDFLETAFSYSESTGGGVYVPKGDFYAPNFSYTFNGVELRIVGEHKYKSKLIGASTISIDTADVYIEGVHFRGQLDDYAFIYNVNSLPISGDTINRYITIKNCVFDSTERAFSMFQNVDNYHNAFNLKIDNNDIKNIGVGGFMFRGYVTSANISSNNFIGVANDSTYNHCISIGDTDLSDSYDINISDNKFEGIFGSESTNLEISYIIISYARGNVISNNQFINCRRGIYSRGESGIVTNNVFLNPDTVGRLPFIFKAADNIVLSDNVVSGKFNGVVLFDSNPTSINVEGNHFDVELNLVSGFSSNNLFEMVGSWGEFILKDNYINIGSKTGNGSSSFAFSSEGDLMFTNNTIIDPGYCISSNNSSSHLHKFTNNTIDCNIFYFGKPKNLIYDNNTFLVSTNTSVNYIRINGGTNVSFDNNRFLVKKGETNYVKSFIDIDGDLSNFTFKRNYIDSASGLTSPLIECNSKITDAVFENNTCPLSELIRIYTYTSGISNYCFNDNFVYDPSGAGSRYLIRTQVDLDSLINVTSRGDYTQEGDNLYVIGVTASVSDTSTFKTIKRYGMVSSIDNSVENEGNVKVEGGNLLLGNDITIGNTTIDAAGTPTDGDIYRYNASNSQMELVEIALSGTGSPSGVVTPDFEGQTYRDTGTDTIYYATGVTNTDWVALN